jgi:hypothetical protein
MGGYLERLRQGPKVRVKLTRIQYQHVDAIFPARQIRNLFGVVVQSSSAPFDFDSRHRGLRMSLRLVFNIASVV